MKKIYSILLCIGLVAGFVACEKDKEFALTTLSINNEVITPAYNSADVRCSFKADATISDAYVQYALSSSFAKYEVAKMTEEKGIYTAQLVGLADNTMYYIRYEVSNKYSSVVTEEVKAFQTLQCTVPTIVLDTITDVMDSHAKVQIHLTFDGGASVTDMGVCWSTHANPTTKDIHISTEDTLAVLDVTSLQPNTKYYIRAYAVNKVGVAYSEEKEFTTNKSVILPSVTTTAITKITETSAVAGGNVTSDGNASVTERGVVYGIKQNPTTDDNKLSSGSGTGEFTCNLANLQPHTIYYVRAYAVNEKGTAYGEELNFTTSKQIALPTVTTNAVTQITETTAVAGGNVTADGNASVTERGVCIATVSNPTTSNTKIMSGSGTGSFTCNLTDLQPNTTYYVRAYAVNSKGTAYGEEVSFTTKEQSSTEPGVAETITVNGVSFTMVAVEGGTFTMGATSEQGSDAYSDDRPTHSVTLSDFAIGETEVTQELWKAVMGSNPSLLSGTNLPVEKVSWNDCQTFISKLNNLTGKNFRLPTEAEWEYAARGGQKSQGYKYAGSNTLGDVAWYYDNSDSNTHPVKQKQANELGLYDMSGNVFEWCQDWYDSYSSSAQTNPTGSTSGSDRVYRGGSLSCEAGICRVSYRNSHTPAYYSSDLGLRLALGAAVELEVALPTVTTNAVTQITETTAVAGGNVTSDGNVSVTERGVCIATVSNPTTSNTKITAGSGTGSFTCNLTGLQANTTYYVRAYATNEKGTAYGEEVSFTTKEQSSTPNNGTENGYAYVDLGLSVKWATCNVGASKPEEYGDYFAWGETQPKDTYDWSTYKWCNGSSHTLTKYCTDNNYGTVDNKTVLDAADDAATANWGGSWRMPTDAELTELRENCTWTWIIENDMCGYRVTSKKENYTDKSIFLPVTSNAAFYWSSSLGSNAPDYACDLYFDAIWVGFSSFTREYGRSVRPVLGESVVETTIPTVTTTIPTQITETSAVAGGNVTADGNASVTERGVCIATVSNPTTSNTKITAGSGTGSFTCNLTGLQANTTYYVRAYAVNSKGTAYGDEVSFTTKEQSSTPSNGTENGYAYVDLGLSVKWATMNVGASSPEEYGDYFAWGEVEPKDYYDWSTYKLCNGSYTTLTKYNNSSNYGTVDNKTQLELTDDAARANWGGAWRMPTYEEVSELCEQCTWIWTNQNGVNGYKVTSKSNGNSIFLPAAGYRRDSSLYKAGSYGNYWSSSLANPRQTWYLVFNSGSVGRSTDYRFYGQSVRSVCQ